MAKQDNRESADYRGLYIVTGALLFVAGVIGFVVLGAVLLPVMFTTEFMLPPELQLVVLALAAGTVGGVVGAIRQVILAVKDISVPRISHLLWLEPVFGALMAFVVYLLIRGGLVLEGSQLQPAGVLAICFLAGYSSRYITEILQRITTHAFGQELQKYDDKITGGS